MNNPVYIYIYIAYVIYRSTKRQEEHVSRLERQQKRKNKNKGRHGCEEKQKERNCHRRCLRTQFKQFMLKNKLTNLKKKYYISNPKDRSASVTPYQIIQSAEH